MLSLYIHSRKAERMHFGNQVQALNTEFQKVTKRSILSILSQWHKVYTPPAITDADGMLHSSALMSVSNTKVTLVCALGVWEQVRCQHLEG